MYMPVLFLVDCTDYYNAQNIKSGVYLIQPNKTLLPTVVYCEMCEGGWTWFQHRQDGSIDFVNQGWEGYKNGFGDAFGEYWLGKN